MEMKRILRNIVFSSLILACRANADILKVDFQGTVYNTYSGNSDGSYEWGGFSWSLKDLFAFDSAVDVSLSYDTDVPSSDSYEENGSSWYSYKGKEITVSSSLFELQTSGVSDISIAVINNLSPGWDILSVGLSDTGIRLDHNGDNYFLVGGDISFYDESGLSIANSSLPQSQEIFDAFWRNRSADAYFDQVASFYLQFKKQPVLEPSDFFLGDMFYVIGYLHEARVSRIPVSEPSTLFLFFAGIFGLAAGRFKCNAA